MRQPTPSHTSTLHRIPGMRWIHFLYHLAKGVESRNAALILLHPPPGLFQPYITTSTDRYPAVFNCLKQALRPHPGHPLRILSFGCSTGEEVFSLRRHFPHAHITGIDINRHNIARCNARLRRRPDPHIRFACAGSTTAEPTESFHAILAMAVFRHGQLHQQQPPPTCRQWIRFQDFDASISDLARCLKPSGLLVLQNSMFRLEDTRLNALFAPLPCDSIHSEGPFYGPDNRLLTLASSPAVIFRKL